MIQKYIYIYSKCVSKMHIRQTQGEQFEAQPPHVWQKVSPLQSSQKMASVDK